MKHQIRNLFKELILRIPHFKINWGGGLKWLFRCLFIFRSFNYICYQALPSDEKEYYKDKAKWEWENRHTTGKYQSNNSSTQKRPPVVNVSNFI